MVLSNISVDIMHKCLLNKLNQNIGKPLTSCAKTFTFSAVLSVKSVFLNKLSSVDWCY